MSATHATDPTAPSGPVLYLAFELGRSSWKLAFTPGAGPRCVASPPGSRRDRRSLDGVRRNGVS
jgi:hypothetical protein